jgi:hypothetical protein
LQFHQVGRSAATQVGDSSSAARDRGSKAAGKIMSDELGVDKASIEAITSASGIERHHRDTGKVIALPALNSSSAGAATLNDDGIHQISEFIQSVVDGGGTAQPQRFVGIWGKKVDLSKGVSQQGGVQGARNILAVHEHLRPKLMSQAQGSLDILAVLQRG